MLELEPGLRKIIAASLYTVSLFDFPEKWPNLLPVIITKSHISFSSLIF